MFNMDSDTILGFWLLLAATTVGGGFSFLVALSLGNETAISIYSYLSSLL